VRLFSLFILTDKIVLVVQSFRVPTPPSTGSLVSVWTTLFRGFISLFLLSPFR
jgi:hypothetical protein